MLRLSLGITFPLSHPHQEKYLSEDDAMHPMLPILRRSLMPNPEHDTEFWKVNAQNFLRNHLGKQNNNLAKNIILVIGDGLSISTITAARVYNNVGGSGAQLSFEMFPHTGLSKVIILVYNVLRIIQILLLSDLLLGPTNGG